MFAFVHVLLYSSKYFCKAHSFSTIFDICAVDVEIQNTAKISQRNLKYMFHARKYLFEDKKHKISSSFILKSESYCKLKIQVK